MSLEERSIRSETALPKILANGAAFIRATDFFYPTAPSNMSDTNILNTISKVSILGRPIQGGKECLSRRGQFGWTSSTIGLL
jgi:hypothetical protein